MRSQLNFLQRPFKAAAASSAHSSMLASQATFCVMSAISSENPSIIHRLNNQQQQAIPTGLFAYQPDQQFHSTASVQKDDNNNGNSEDNGNVKNTIHDRDEAALLEPKQLREFRSQGRPKCPQCGKPLQDCKKTVNNNRNLLYCNECNFTFDRGSSNRNFSSGYHILTQHAERTEFLTPKDLKAYLDGYVIGQERAKRDMAQAVYEHIIRVDHNEQVRRMESHDGRNGHMQSRGIAGFSQDIMNPSHESYARKKRTNGNGSGFIFSHPNDQIVHMRKQNLLFLGPSGVGKTYMVQVLARQLNLPMAQCDCTSLTQAGYVGDDVDSVLQKLLQEAEGEVTKAQTGIVFLDEIDKIAGRETFNTAHRDVSGEGVQHAMLKMVEGSVVNVKSSRKAQPQNDTVQIDTTDILFIGSGAFTGLEKIISRRMDQKQMGFGADLATNRITADDEKDQQEFNEKRDKLLQQVQSEDVIKFGMIPELVGRFPVRVPFHSLDKESLKRVMTDPKDSLLAQAKLYFKKHSAELEMTEEALDEIAKQAMKSKVGARALNSALHDVLKDAKYELPGSDIVKVRITGEFVRGEAPYEVERRQLTTTQVSSSAAAV